MSGSVARGARLYGQSMHPLLEQIGEGMVHRPLAGDAAHAGKGRGLDLDGEMAFASTGIVAAMPAMFLTVVNHLKMCRSECLGQAFGDFRSNGAG